MKLHLNKDFYCIGYDLYKKDIVDLKPGLTVLVGCNGSGKSTLLHQLKETAKEMQIPEIYYNNLRDGQNNAMDYALNVSGDMALLAKLATSSEGEQIYTNFETFAKKIGRFMRELESGKKEVFILLDAIDSGLSIDTIEELKSFFDFIQKEEKKNGHDVYIVISSNEYELCEGSQCLVIPEMEYKTFSDYKDYKKAILDSREYKDNELVLLKQKREQRTLDFKRDISHKEKDFCQEKNPFPAVAPQKGSKSDNEVAQSLFSDMPDDTFSNDYF